MNKPLMALTAADLMARDVIRLPEDLPLRDGVRLLLRNHVGGAPVVDAQGRCVGVFSAVDVLRLAEKHGDLTRPVRPARPLGCSFQTKRRRPDGSEVAICTLPPGVCPIQMRETHPGDKDLLVCTQPHCVLTDWQVVQLEKLPDEAIRHYMTPNPVLIRPTASIRVLARLMLDAHIHRLIVADEERKPVGIVSGTDLMAAIAYANGGQQATDALHQEIADSLIYEVVTSGGS